MFGYIYSYVLLAVQYYVANLYAQDYPCRKEDVLDENDRLKFASPENLTRQCGFEGKRFKKRLFQPLSDF